MKDEFRTLVKKTPVGLFMLIAFAFGSAWLVRSQIRNGRTGSGIVFRLCAGNEGTSDGA